MKDRIKWGQFGKPLLKAQKEHLSLVRNDLEYILTLLLKRKIGNTDIQATNILLQGLPKDIYTLINHYTDAKDIWDNVKMLLEGSELTKEDREHKGESIHDTNGESIQDYYVQFPKLINDMRNIKMTMSRLQLNSKFVNNMLPEWGRFMTAVKLNRGLRDSNYDQLGQGMNPRGGNAAGYEGAQTRVRNVNPGQARPNSEYYKDKMLVMQAQENEVALDAEQLLFLAGGQDNACDDDVDEQPVQDLALNVDNVFQADDCDTFDFDVDEALTAQTMFMANLSSADPITDEAGPSYDSDILSEVQDHDHYQNAACAHHEEHMMHDSVQPNHVVDSHADYTSDSNMIPYDQYVKDNEVPVVHSDVSSALNDAFMMIYNDICEPHPQSVSNPSWNTVVKNSLTAELTTYKEHVELNNKDAHLDYLRHLKESVVTIRDIVEEAKVVRPLDRSIVFSCRYTKHSQELLEYAIGTCPQGSRQRAKQLTYIPLIRKKQVTFAKPSDKSDSTTHQHVVTVKPQKTNVPVPPSTRVNSCPNASGSQLGNPIYKIAVDLLKNTNFFRAFTASSTIPSIYIQQFWDMVQYDKKAGSYRCQLDKQWNVSNVVTNDMLQPWRALITIINLCLMGKTSRFEKPRALMLQILWGIIKQANIDYAERIWEEFVQSIHTFIEDKQNLSRHTTGKKRATLIVILSIRFTKLIIHHLQRRHKFHPRPDSPLHLPNEEHVLGYLKFSAKGTKREDSPAPKPTKPARKPKSTAPKAPTRHVVSTPVTLAQPAPTSAPAKPQEKKRKQATETSDKPPKVKKSKYGVIGKKRSRKYVATSEAEDVPVMEPRVTAEDTNLQKALEESMKTAYVLPRGPLPPVVIREPKSGKYQPLPEVPGKGKAKVTEEQPKKKIPTDQYIFQRHVYEPTGSSGHDESPYAVLGQSDSEEELEKVVLGADEGGQGERQAGPDLGAQAEGQTGSDAGDQDEG
uniref:Putative zinc finger, CCHC-type n=1 Tax=Tanacetum cinerariifolium TaxID=118510 RepID=A0A6L2PBZ3_TANCI|nr:putative zinc finger, CCHC-type [Tanacetum cinerariifolium]